MTIEANIARQSRQRVWPEEALMTALSSSAGIVAKFATACGGVWIEETPTPLGTTRVWRFDAAGNAEWADHAAVLEGFPRWFGHQFKAKDFILC